MTNAGYDNELRTYLIRISKDTKAIIIQDEIIPLGYKLFVPKGSKDALLYKRR